MGVTLDKRMRAHNNPSPLAVRVPACMPEPLYRLAACGSKPL